MSVDIFGGDFPPFVVDDGGDPDPLWWADVLYADLRARMSDVALFDRYYRGDHPLPWLAPQAADGFRRILQMTRTNYMGLVVDAMTERLEVLGFRVGDDEAGDREAWRIWQANNLDALSGEAFLEAAKVGSSYLLVAPNPDDPKTPRVTIEHPSQFVIGYEPGDVQKRAAALKVWYDSARRVTMATLYMPDFIFKFVGGKDSRPLSWVPRQVVGEPWPLPNPLGVVPAVELRNNPQTYFIDDTLVYCGTSEISDVIDIQDRVNKTIADRLMTQDFGAFPHRWATGWPNDEDEDAGQGDLATTASTNRDQPIDVGRDRMTIAGEGVQFGQFSAAPLDPYSAAKNEDVKDIAARTRTPAQYLLGELVNISAEALQAAESGLVSKVKQRRRPFGEALEETVRMYLRAAGDTRAEDGGTETLWRDPEYRSQAQLTDAVIKRRQVELISWNQAMEDMGYTPAQIKRNKQDLEAERMEAAARAIVAGIGATPPATPPPGDGNQQPQDEVL